MTRSLAQEGVAKDEERALGRWDIHGHQRHSTAVSHRDPRSPGLGCGPVPALKGHGWDFMDVHEPLLYAFLSF